ncbi:MAG: hypothetical protein QOD00_3787 [Blastocatellia bacterium]|jgi:hypothetical protein|nr:hypothetical protein [Blastocatellia bacterium]
MKSNRRLAILSLIIMTLVSTPRAVQQLSHSINAAQERAGLVWWNLLLTPDAQAAESTVAQTNSPCTEPFARRMTPSINTTTARNNAVPSAATGRKAETRSAQRQASWDFSVGPEVAANNSSGEGVIDTAAWSDASATLSKQDAAQRERQKQLASHAAPQAGAAWNPAKLQSAMAALDGHDAPTQPPYLHVVGDMDTSEFPSRPAMDALLAVLAKKGLNVQFRMRKTLDRNQTPRPRARTLIGKDALPLPTATRCECPVG